jgi:hypothetical protein
MKIIFFWEKNKTVMKGAVYPTLRCDLANVSEQNVNALSPRHCSIATGHWSIYFNCNEENKAPV